MSATPARQRCSLFRVLACLAVWVVAAAMALLVASETSFGPIVLDLSADHGVHAGDVLAVIVGALLATVATVVILAPCLRALWNDPDASPDQTAVQFDPELSD